MKTLVLVFHPNLKESRVNKVFAETIDKEENVKVRSMYDIYPNGNIDVAREHEFLLDADRIVLQFPFYWYSAPSLLKEWEDKVLDYGWAFGTDGDKLHNKELLIATTTGADGYSRGGEVKYSVEELLRPFQAANNLIGTRYLKPFIINNSMAIDANQIEKYAKEYANYTTNPELEGLGDYE